MSTDIDVPDEQVLEHIFARGWTDGLPIVPPTADLVDRMLGYCDLDRTSVIGEIPARHRHVTVEKAAANAVMAGCRPEYFPVVLAGLRACLAPAFNAHSTFSSTGGAATCLIVSGEYVAKLGMNSGHNVLGPGNRANATIGRAVRLVARNVFGARSDAMDGSSIGQPGKFTFCFAEEAPPAPWQSLALQFGLDAGQSIVIAMSTEGPQQLGNSQSNSGEDILRTIAVAMRAPRWDVIGSGGDGGQGIVILGPEHRELLREQGWTQQEIRQYLADASRRTPAEFRNGGHPSAVKQNLTLGPDGKLAVVASADDLVLVTAGGWGNGWSAWIPGFGSLALCHFTWAVI